MGLVSDESLIILKIAGTCTPGSAHTFEPVNIIAATWEDSIVRHLLYSSCNIYKTNIKAMPCLGMQLNEAQSGP